MVDHSDTPTPGMRHEKKQVLDYSHGPHKPPGPRSYILRILILAAALLAGCEAFIRLFHVNG